MNVYMRCFAIHVVLFIICDYLNTKKKEEIDNFLIIKC